MPLTGVVRKRQMDTTTPPVAKSTNSGVSTPQGTSSPKRTVDKTIPLKKVIKDDSETLADSQPLSADTLSSYGTSLGAASALSSTASLGGFSISTIILVLLTAAVAYLLIRKGK